jgi:hypothetical protein
LRAGTILMAGTVAIVARPAFFRPAAGPPDLDQFGSSSGFGRGVNGSAGIGRRFFRSGCGGCIDDCGFLRRFALLRRFHSRCFNFYRSRRIGLYLDRSWLAFAGHQRKRDLGQQRGGRCCRRFHGLRDIIGNVGDIVSRGARFRSCFR